MFGAEGNLGPIERMIRRSEDSNADPRTDEVALGYFTNKPLCLDPRFLGRFSGFFSIAGKSSAQKFFLVAAIYEHSVGTLVKTLFIDFKNMHRKKQAMEKMSNKRRKSK